MIIGFVKGQQFSKKQPVIVSNSINYLEARFVFQTSDWSELVKFAHFKSGDSVYDFLLDGDTIPKEAQLNLYAGNWEVYIHGDRYVVDDDGNEKIVERITTNTQTVQVVKYEQNGNVLPEVGTSVAEQIAAVADSAKKIATSVRNEADAGAFDGKDGYTPVKGVDYFDGNDGVSVTHEWKGTVLEVTSASGSSSVDLKGEKGERGTTGSQGEHGNSFYKSINNIYGANAEVLEKDISTAGRKVQYGDLVLSPNGSVYTVRAINGDTVSLHDGGFSLKGPAGSDYNLTNADKTEIAGMAAEMIDGVTVSNTATPGQMLLVKAVDENGKPTEWETVDRTHYKGEAVLESFVPDATVTVSEGMGFGIDISSAKVGETYIVNWDATEHECVCKLAAYNGMTVIAIGNVALFGGAENTGEPFVLGYIPALGMSGAFSITDGSHTVSAKKKTIPVTTLPNEYVSGLVLEKSIGTVNVVAETTFEGDRYDFIAPDFSLIEGEKYTVVFDETAYECTAYKLAMDASNVYVMLGNSSLLYNLGNSSSEPFLISYLLRTSELAFAAETSASHTLSVNRTTEVYERLPKECMPEEYTMETPFFDLAAMGLPEIKVGEEVELRADDAEPLQALRLALMRGQVKVRFMFNPTGDYPRSVTTVVSGVYGDGMQTHFSTMIRCWGWDIGFHAVTVGVGDVQIWAKAYSLAT